MFCFAFIFFILQLLFIYCQLSLSNSECGIFRLRVNLVKQIKNQAVLTHTLVGWIGGGPCPWPVLVERGTVLTVDPCSVMLTSTHQTSLLIGEAVTGMAITLAPANSWENISILLRLIVSVDTHKKFPLPKKKKLRMWHTGTGGTNEPDGWI